jgi:hypothetical protein
MHKKDFPGAIIMMFTSDRAKSISIERRFAAQQGFFARSRGSTSGKNVLQAQTRSAARRERSFSRMLGAPRGEYY